MARRHKPEWYHDSAHSWATGEQCVVCGAKRQMVTNGSRFYPWYLKGHPQPYCPEEDDEIMLSPIAQVLARIARERCTT